MKVLKKIARLFVRVWFTNRDVELWRQLRALRKGLQRRKEMWNSCSWADDPAAAYESWMKSDRLLRRARDLYKVLDEFFEGDTHD